MNAIKVELTIDEANLVLEALGQLPFARVYALIGRLQDQARAQLQPAQAQLQAVAAPRAESQA